MPVDELGSRVDNSQLLIVKVDIEGFEADLFGANKDWVSDTCALIVEPHDWMLPATGSSIALQETMMGMRRDMLISGENLVWIRARSSEVALTSDVNRPLKPRVRP